MQVHEWEWKIINDHNLNLILHSNPKIMFCLLAFNICCHFIADVLLHRCTDLICCGWCSSGPYLKGQPRKTYWHTRLQITHWHSGAYSSLVITFRSIYHCQMCIGYELCNVFYIFEQGIEDYLGDMDFKLAGTNKGITALQARCL